LTNNTRGEPEMASNTHSCCFAYSLRSK